MKALDVWAPRLARVLLIITLPAWLASIVGTAATLLGVRSLAAWGPPAMTLGLVCVVAAIALHPKRGFTAGRGPSGLGNVTQDAARPWAALAWLTTLAVAVCWVVTIVAHGDAHTIPLATAAVPYGWVLAMLSAGERRRAEMSAR